MPLFAFNLGVEASQLSIAAIVLHRLAAATTSNVSSLRHSRLFIIVAFAGAYWLIERTILS